MAKKRSVSKKSAGKKLNIKPIVTILAIIIIGVVAFFLLKGEETNYYSFAACMKEKGLIEIGSDSCLHCENEKRIIGHDAFKKEYDEKGMYLRCNFDPILCSNLGIRGTPTWYMPSPTGKQINVQGNKFSVSGTFTEYLGEQTIPKLSEITGCPIPPEYDSSKAPKAGGYTGA